MVAEKKSVSRASRLHEPSKSADMRVGFARVGRRGSLGPDFLFFLVGFGGSLFLVGFELGFGLLSGEARNSLGALLSFFLELLVSLLGLQVFAGDLLAAFLACECMALVFCEFDERSLAGLDIGNERAAGDFFLGEHSAGALFAEVPQRNGLVAVHRKRFARSANDADGLAANREGSEAVEFLLGSGTGGRRRGALGSSFGCLGSLGGLVFFFDEFSEASALGFPILSQLQLREQVFGRFEAFLLEALQQRQSPPRLPDIAFGSEVALGPRGLHQPAAIRFLFVFMCHHSLDPGMRTEKLSAASGLGIGIEFEHHEQILQGIFAVFGMSLVFFFPAQQGDDFRGFQQSSQVGVGDDGSGQIITNFGGGFSGVRAIEGLQALISGLRPDDESANVAARRQIEQIEASHTAQVDARQIPEGAAHSRFVEIDDQRALLESVAAISGLTLASADFLGVLGLLGIPVGFEHFQKPDGSLGLCDVVNGFIAYNERDFRDFFDFVAPGKDKRHAGGCCQGRHDGVSPLIDVDFAVPFSIRLGGREHMAAPTHVSEGSLSGAMGASSGNSGNTRHCPARAPRFCRGLMTSAFHNGVGLPGVLGNVTMDVMNNIWSDWSQHYSGEFRLADDLAT